MHAAAMQLRELVLVQANAPTVLRRADVNSTARVQLRVVPETGPAAQLR